MAYNEGGLSASDVALLTGNNNGFGGNGDNAWWIILFLIFGWGRNGFGGGYGGGSGVADNYVLATDFATIERTAVQKMRDEHIEPEPPPEETEPPDTNETEVNTAQ